MILYLLFAVATSGSPTSMPAHSACIKATLTRRGRFTGSEVAVSSGVASIDRDALKLVDNFDVSRLPSAKDAAPQTGYVVVTVNEKGDVTAQFSGQLLTACPA